MAQIRPDLSTGLNLDDLETNNLLLEDAITAPATVTGRAQIYVDTATGFLKAKFGDGVVSILAPTSNPTTVTTTSHTAGDANIILVDDDTAGSAVTVTLLAAASGNQIYQIKKLGTTASVTVDGNGAETIDGAANAVISTQYESITVVSDGTQWWIL